MLTFESYLGRKRAEDYNDRLIKAVEGYGDLMQIGTAGGRQMFKVVLNPGGRRTVCFIAGLHGDEPAGPAGVLDFLEDKIYVPKTKKIVIIPLANPTSYESNTRENADKVDINRSFYDEPLRGEARAVWEAIKDEKVELLHTLHEDPEAGNFYVYYTDNDELAVDLRDLARKYFEIESKGKVYGDKNRHGLVPPPHTHRNTVEDRVADLNIPYITTETPGKAKLSKRTEYTKKAMRMTINSF